MAAIMFFCCLLFVVQIQVVFQDETSISAFELLPSPPASPEPVMKAIENDPKRPLLITRVTHTYEH